MSSLSTGDVSRSVSNTTPTVLDDGTDVPPNLYGDPAPNAKIVSVAVGVGGRILAGVNGFQTVIADIENFSADLQSQIVPDPNDPTKSICPAPTIFLPASDDYSGNGCCFGALHECIGGGWHSDFLYRGVAYGNGRFVAAGGATWGISRYSTDGVHWSQKFNLTPSTGLVAGENGAWWVGDIAFGAGHFVAADSDGNLLISTDGQHWEAHGSKLVQYARHIEYIGDRFYVLGDNNLWAFTNADGTDWEASGTGGIMPTQILMSGNSYYGLSGQKIYRLEKADIKTNNWVEVYSNTDILDSLGYNPTTKKFFVMTRGNSFLTSASLMGPWVQEFTFPWWQTNGYGTKFDGKNFVGAGAYSADGGKTWLQGQSQYKSSLIDIAIGYVVTP